MKRKMSGAAAADHDFDSNVLRKFIEQNDGVVNILIKGNCKKENDYIVCRIYKKRHLL